MVNAMKEAYMTNGTGMKDYSSWGNGGGNASDIRSQSGRADWVCRQRDDRTENILGAILSEAPGEEMACVCKRDRRRGRETEESQH